MSAGTDRQICRRCQRPVAAPPTSYDMFEQMHFVCFHFEFEHDPVDVDDECGLDGCPSAQVPAEFTADGVDPLIAHLMALDDSSLTGEGPNASVRRVSRNVVEVSTGDGHLWLVTVKKRRPREG